MSHVPTYLVRALFALLLFLPGIALSEDTRPRIVTTTGMISDITREIASDIASVVGLMGAGTDPHLYKPTRSDIATLTGANVVFYNGLLLEGKMTDALIRVATGGTKVVAVTELLPPDFLLEPAEFQGHYDPHVWMDPGAWSKAAILIAEKLALFYPEHKTRIQTNAIAYEAKIRELERYAEGVLQTVPDAARVLVTAHDAFNYFGRRFQYQVVGIQGISTESEAGVRDLERVVQLLVEKRIGAVFVETTVSERNVRALIEGAAARGQVVRIGGSLYSDAMGAPGSYEGTYIGMIDHNVTTIARALGGVAPERGMTGRLAVTVEKP